MTKLLIKDGRVIDPASGIDKKADILIENGRIKQIGKDLKNDTKEVINAQGLVVSPGFIDTHVHLREPGFEEKETIETGSKAAIAGGITSMLSMPNTNPVTDEPSVINFIKEKQEQVGLTDIYPVAAVTKRSEGKELSEIYHLSEAGAVAFSDDGSNIDDSKVMRRALEYSKLVDKPICVHAEDGELSNGGQVNEGFMATKLGLKGIPSIAEEAIIYRDIGLARLTGARIHFMHVSTAESVKLIREAKKEKLPITCEVTPHHLVLDETYLESYDSNFKVKPPLRSKNDKKELLKGLKDGTIDCIASDHAPHAKHDKEKEFDYADFGMIGLETLFNLVYTNFERELTLPLLLEKITKNPAKIFNLDAGSLEVDSRADITIIDPKGKVKVESSNLLSKSKNTPFIGWDLTGKIELVIKRGKPVYKNGLII